MKPCKTSPRKREQGKQRRWRKEYLTRRQHDQLLYERKICEQCGKEKLLQGFAIPYEIEKFYDICRKCRKAEQK